jgi:alpha-tubulin suppressor-like RCC1 family protein
MNYGTLGDNTSIDRPSPVTVLRPEGDGPLESIVKLDTGLHATCALVDEKLWCWGSNFDGKVGDGTVAYRKLPVPVLDSESRGAFGVASSFDTESDSTCAVQDGRVYCWGKVFSGRIRPQHRRCRDPARWQR